MAIVRREPGLPGTALYFPPRLLEQRPTHAERCARAERGQVVRRNLRTGRRVRWGPLGFRPQLLLSRLCDLGQVTFFWKKEFRKTSSRDYWRNDSS